MQKALGVVFMVFGVLDLFLTSEFPDTMLAIVLLTPPPVIAWMYLPVGALLCAIFGGVTLCTRRVGLYGLLLLGVAYAGLHFIAALELPALEHGLTWFDFQAVASLATWFVLIGCVGSVLWKSPGAPRANGGF